MEVWLSFFSVVLQWCFQIPVLGSNCDDASKSPVLGSNGNRSSLAWLFSDPRPTSPCACLTHTQHTQGERAQGERDSTPTHMHTLTPTPRQRQRQTPTQRWETANSDQCSWTSAIAPNIINHFTQQFFGGEVILSGCMFLICCCHGVLDVVSPHVRIDLPSEASGCPCQACPPGSAQV